MSAVRFELDIPIGPEWRNVELLRTAILSCLAAVFQNDDYSETVGMITGELVENAIKYGDWSRDQSQFKIHVHGDDDGVDVRVQNPVRSPDAAEQALRAVRWIAQFASPAEAYRARLREVAESGAGDGSGLGLVRIAYEGGCAIDGVLQDGGILSMHARTRR